MVGEGTGGKKTWQDHLFLPKYHCPQNRSAHTEWNSFTWLIWKHRRRNVGHSVLHETLLVKMGNWNSTMLKTGWLVHRAMQTNVQTTEDRGGHADFLHTDHNIYLYVKGLGRALWSESLTGNSEILEGFQNKEHRRSKTAWALAADIKYWLERKRRKSVTNGGSMQTLTSILIKP